MKEYTYHDVNLRGTVETVSYRTVNRDGEPRIKRCNVYLPYGYDPENPAPRHRPCRRRLLLPPSRSCTVRGGR